MSKNSQSDSQGKMIVFGAKQIRRAWVNGEWFFSVVDIVGALTDSAAPAKYWDAMKRREKESSGIDLSTLCRKVKLTSADGKAYESEAVYDHDANGWWAFLEIADPCDAKNLDSCKVKVADIGLIRPQALFHSIAGSGVDSPISFNTDFSMGYR